jgi:Short C-terminal domain
MVIAWQVVANAKLPATPRAWDPRLLWLTLALAGIILVGAVVIALLDRWRKHAAPEVSTANDQLAQFRELYERGELSQAEFDRIRATLEKELRREWNVPTPKPAAENPEQVPQAKDSLPDRPPPQNGAAENPPVQGA